MNLLTKIRNLSNQVQNKEGSIVEALSYVIKANVYFINLEGEILSSSTSNVTKDDPFSSNFAYGIISDEMTQKLMQVNQTQSVVLDSSIKGFITIIPVRMSGTHFGSFVLYRLYKDFEDEDIILGEYGATVIGMQMLQIKTEKLAKEVQEQTVLKLAVNSLSYSELESAKHVFNKLDGMEGLIVASKIADHAGLTRSVIVNTLRKLESAGVVESRSLGMKGTYIKILHPKLKQTIERARG